MRWLKQLFASRARREPETAMWIYVRCTRCGEPIQIRADRRYDLVSEMLEPGENGPAYTMCKDIVGQRCFQRISVRLAFDRRLQLAGHEIHGGQLLSEQEYQQVMASQEPS